MDFVINSFINTYFTGKVDFLRWTEDEEQESMGMSEIVHIKERSYRKTWILTRSHDVSGNSETMVSKVLQNEEPITKDFLCKFGPQARAISAS